MKLFLKLTALLITCLYSFSSAGAQQIGLKEEQKSARGAWIFITEQFKEDPYLAWATGGALAAAGFLGYANYRAKRLQYTTQELNNGLERVLQQNKKVQLEGELFWKQQHRVARNLWDLRTPEFNNIEGVPLLSEELAKQVDLAKLSRAERAAGLDLVGRIERLERKGLPQPELRKILNTLSEGAAAKHTKLSRVLRVVGSKTLVTSVLVGSAGYVSANAQVVQMRRRLEENPLLFLNLNQAELEVVESDVQLTAVCRNISRNLQEMRRLYPTVLRKLFTTGKQRQLEQTRWLKTKLQKEFGT